jgi:hypothetical protein
MVLSKNLDSTRMRSAMHSRTITHTEDGPVTLSLDITAGPIAVRVEEGCTHAEVILSETYEGDERARKLIDDTTTTSTGREFTVNVPRVEGAIGGGAAVFAGDGFTSVISGNVSGSVIQAGVISGGVVMGGGQVIVGGVNMTNQAGGSGQAGGMVAVTATLPPGSSLKVQTIASELHTTGHLDSVRYRGKGGGAEVDTTTNLDVDTTGGSIRANRADSAEVNTSGGSIRLGTTTDAELHTSGGNLTITKLAGRAKLRTSGGDINVHAVGKSKIRARTSGGDIEVTKEPGIEIDCEANTSGGRVRTPSQ